MGYSEIHIIELHPGVLFSEKGSVARWGKNVGRQALRAIRDEAPVNVRGGGGTLRNSLVMSRRFSQARLSGRITVSTDVHYAPYVIHGTGPITTDKENGLFLPAVHVGSNPNSRSRWQGGTFRAVGFEGRPGPEMVQGQLPNDFFSRGWNRMAIRHAAVAEF